MRNLKTLLVVCFLSLGALSASAQGLGIKAGLNVSNAAGGDVSDSDFKPGFNIGLMYQKMLVGDFGLQAGLEYSMKGDKDVETTNLSYIQVPIQALYKFSVGPGLSLYPAAGLYLGYGIGGSHDFFDYGEEFDLGLALGVNLQFEKIVIGLGYERGFLTVFDGIDAYNQNITVNVGYFF